MAILGKPAARGLKSKGMSAKDVKNGGSSRATKNAFTRLKRSGK